MFGKYKTVSLCTVLFVSQLAAQIIEISTLQELFDHVPVDSQKTTIIFCDLDNTLVMPDFECGLGSDAWFSHHAKRIAQELAIDISKVYKTMLPIYYDVNLVNQYTLRPVENGTVALLKEMQQRFDHVVGLTARSYPLIDSTIQLLQDIDIDFMRSAIATEKNIEHSEGRYLAGIGFCGWEKKSVVMDLILTETGYTCDRIVMIDDKAHYLDDIEQMLALKYPDVEFIGIHYTYLAEHVQEYQPSYVKNR